MSAIVIRRFFPSKSTCPMCGSTAYGHGSHSVGLSFRYRRCSSCNGTYKVAAIAEEVDIGGKASVIRPAT